MLLPLWASNQHSSRGGIQKCRLYFGSLKRFRRTSAILSEKHGVKLAGIFYHHVILLPEGKQLINIEHRRKRDRAIPSGHLAIRLGY